MVCAVVPRLALVLVEGNVVFDDEMSVAFDADCSLDNGEESLGGEDGLRRFL